jgi:hypothetical protein
MKKFWSTLSNRFWMAVVTAGFTPVRSSAYHFTPGDEERLIAALMNMNSALARAGRMI